MLESLKLLESAKSATNQPEGSEYLIYATNKGQAKISATKEGSGTYIYIHMLQHSLDFLRPLRHGSWVHPHRGAVVGWVDGWGNGVVVYK